MGIFGGNVFNEKEFKDIAPPFVVRRVDKFGSKCSQTNWDKYSVGTLIELQSEDKMVELEDEEYLAIDWNEQFFQTFFEENMNENKSISFFNNQSLVFDQL